MLVETLKFASTVRAHRMTIHVKVSLVVHDMLKEKKDELGLRTLMPSSNTFARVSRMEWKRILHRTATAKTLGRW